MRSLLLVAGIAVSLLCAQSTSASPVSIYFSGTVTDASYDIYVVAPEVGEQFQGAVYFDTDDVSGSISVQFGLGGMVPSSTVLAGSADDAESYPDAVCSPRCDVWSLTFITLTPWESGLRIYNEILFVDETGAVASGGEFFVPASLAGWTRVTFEAFHPDYGGLYRNVEATIDTWTVVPEPGAFALACVGLVLIAAGRRRRAPSRLAVE